MTYGHSEIFEHSGTHEHSAEMNITGKIRQIWNNYKKKRLLRSFEEIEPKVFVQKKEITDRLKLKIKKIRKRKLTKGKKNE